MITPAQVILALLAVIAVGFSVAWWKFHRDNAGKALSASRAGPPDAADVGTGFATNFFDTLGIGSFAPTTAVFKFRQQVADEDIPGTLNVGHALPTIAQALIFIATVVVAPGTLIPMIIAAVAGAWLGAGIVPRLPRRTVQLVMGVALAIAATLFIAKNLDILPGGGEATGLEGGVLAFAVAGNFVLGALMSLGIGLYAPCLIMVSLLGMSPLAAFPIMMGSCAFLMPTGGLRFIRNGRYSAKAAIGLAIGGVPGVLIAAYLVRELPMTWLRWMVVVVVLYAAIVMLRSALASRADATRPA